jgi:hypothetical protein
LLKVGCAHFNSNSRYTGEFSYTVTFIWCDRKTSILRIIKSKGRTRTSINICHNFQLVVLSLDSVAPTLFTIGSGSLIGFLVGFALKRIFKILAIIVGLFFAALMYFQSQT